MTDSDLPEETAHHTAPANQPDAPSSTDPRQEVQQLRHKLQDYERWFEASDNQVRILERERRKLAAVLNGTDAGFLVLDASNRIVWTNRVFRTLFPGVNPKELSGAACCTVVCGRTTTCEACPGPRAFGTGQVAHHEMRLDVGGTTRYIYGTAMPIRSQSGEIEETIVMLQDVSDLEVLRQSQTALQSSEERFRSIFSTASAGMASLSPDGTFLQANPALCALLGYSREELLRRTVYDVTHPDDLETTRRLFAECNAGVQSTLQVVKRYRRRDGSVCWGQTSASWLYDAEGRPVYSVALVQDVTERRLAEEALQAQKSQVLLLQRVAVAANEATSHQEAIRTCLDRVCAHTGWPLGHAWLRLNDEATLVPTALWHAEEPSRFAEFRLASESARLGRGEGLPGLVLQRAVPIWLQDVGEHENFPQRAAAAATCGIGAAIGLPVLVGREVAGVLEFFTTSKVEPDARLMEVLGHVGAQIGRVIERERASAALLDRDEQLLQVQKMEAIGTLAGGVAHDFNNILTGILGHVELLKSAAPEDARIRRAAEVIERAGRRAAALTQQLLGFARKGKHQSVPVDLHATIREVIGLLSRTIDKNISITQAYRAGRSLTMGDPGQVQQVILNLAVNARDAMPGGGALSFSTDLVQIGESDLLKHPDASPGTYVRIAVRDTGHGIPDELLQRIFEPFFTTKEQGKGTGMGLAMVYGIVKNHGGLIEVESVVGSGTTFSILLPLAMGKSASAERGPQTRAIAGSGRVLVVDDEEIIRDIATDFLTGIGYTVMTARDGQEAVELYRCHSGAIDLVVIDMVMPTMGGRDCFRALKRLNPSVKALLSSGYGLNHAVQEILDEGMLSFVQKPYDLADLSAAIARALGR